MESEDHFGGANCDKARLRYALKEVSLSNKLLAFSQAKFCFFFSGGNLMYVEGKVVEGKSFLYIIVFKVSIDLQNCTNPKLNAKRVHPRVELGIY